MFGKKRCSLCGGKLIDNKCTLCGLDNSKSDENYKMNTSSCDGQPLTHVHEVQEAEYDAKKKEKMNNRKKVEAAVDKSGGKKKKMWMPIFMAVMILVGANTIITNVWKAIDSDGNLDFHMGEEDYDSEGSYEYEEDYDYREHLYDFVTRDLAEEGEVYEEELSPGQYIVGIHIPEGTYHVDKLTVQNETQDSYLVLDDFENSIYLGEDFSDPKKEVSDLRCYSGAIIKISGDKKLHFYSENAQISAMTGVENPLKEAVEVKNGWVAGIDFPAGAYDIVERKNPDFYADFTYVLPNELTGELEEQGFRYEEEFLWVTAEEEDYIYRNLWLPEGTELTIEYGEALHLEPSKIVPEDEKLFYHQNK